MKNFNKFFLIITLLAFLYSCDKYGNGKGRNVDPDTDSDAPAWAGGNKDDNIHRNQNDDTGVVKGDDYGDLYILLRNADGVPNMEFVTVVDEHGESIVWYPLAMAFDEFGNPVMENGEYVALTVNELGEIDDANYFPKEVDFGRLNIIRAPSSVLDDALAEAIANLMLGDYITTDASGRLVAVHGEEDWLPGVDEEDDKTIDAPRENMAIYRELMQFGNASSNLNFLNQYFTNNELLKIAASAFAAGSDKTGIVTKDEIVYTNGFMDAYNPDDAIKLIDVYPSCEDPYYKALMFYNFNNFQYNRNEQYANEWLKITTLYPGGTYTIEVVSVLDAVPFETELEGGTYLNNLEAFTFACDDAVQVLEFIHESDLIEYLGRHDAKPEL